MQPSAPKTFVEKILGAPEGAIVFRTPEIVLANDNTASIERTFERMGGERVLDPGQLFVALDHNAPPASAGLANDHQAVRDFVKKTAHRQVLRCRSGSREFHFEALPEALMGIIEKNGLVNWLKEA
jgi:homoaconitase/3-isopropylmalate dehydratase large subunit